MKILLLVSKYVTQPIARQFKKKVIWLVEWEEEKEGNLSHWWIEADPGDIDGIWTSNGQNSVIINSFVPK